MPALAQAENASQASAGAQSQQAYRFDIPAKPLPQAIADLSAVTGLQVLYTEQSTFDHTAPALRGSYTVRDALQRLLAGSGLVVRFTGENSVTIELASQGGAQTLPPVRVSASAEAQDGSAAEGYKVSNTTGIGPWRERSLQDTPYSLSVISEELIENAFVTDMDQIAKINPVVQLGRSSSFDDTQTPIIRGFGIWSQIVDGIRLSAPPQGISVEEVERIEVLSGLSGFLYGSGNVGGTVNYVLKRPTQEKLNKLTLGNYGGSQYFSHLDLGGPINENGTFGYRINLMHQNGETAVDGQDKEKTLISGAFDWHVNEDLLVQLEASHREYEMQKPSASFDFRGSSVFPDPYDNSKSYTPGWNNFDSETDRISLKSNWSIAESYTLRTALLRKEHNWYSGAITTFPRLKEESNAFAVPTALFSPQERVNEAAYIYLDGELDWGGMKHKLTLGLSGDTYETTRYEVSSFYNPPWGSTDTFSLNEIESVAMADLSFDKGRKYQSNKTTSKNIIIGDDITINNQWSLMAGVNYTTLGSYSYNVDGDKTQSYKESDWTPTLSLIYKPLENISTYITYMEALENGVIVGENFTNAGDVLDPLVSKQYEVGAKFDLNERALLSASLFRIEKANQFSDGTEPLPTYVQDGLQVHQGVEFLLTGKVSENLTLNGGFTVMDLKVEDASDPGLEGKEPTNVAPKTAKLYAEYSVPGIQGLVLTGGTYYTGERYADTANVKDVDSYVLYDLGARYTTVSFNKPLTLRLNIANLTDEDYWAAATDSGSELGMPRTISFSASMNF